MNKATERNEKIKKLFKRIPKDTIDKVNTLSRKIDLSKNNLRKYITGDYSKSQEQKLIKNLSMILKAIVGIMIAFRLKTTFDELIDEYRSGNMNTFKVMWLVGIFGFCLSGIVIEIITAKYISDELEKIGSESFNQAKHMLKKLNIIYHYLIEFEFKKAWLDAVDLVKYMFKNMFDRFKKLFVTNNIYMYASNVFGISLALMFVGYFNMDKKEIANA